MKPSANTPIVPVPESTYRLFTKSQSPQSIQATRIGVNESGALLIMKQNPATGRHDPVRILANGHWSDIELIQAEQ
ncbi:hypothetical protein RQP54_18585 [Curvibacter sp. APW13]|uniref:hypothetical protein n=1 Tax=Curvibacter sp. APW13 TaxID=3077236 RepID=UPI0028E0069E|nr:hypothetical protein [Curvibacter sp. APW13]MDT8992888.1 hypothetical protein [Curvibacter sp. APW13]